MVRKLTAKLSLIVKITASVFFKNRYKAGLQTILQAIEQMSQFWEN